MRIRSWTEAQLRKAILTSISMRQVLVKLNLKPTGGNYKQLYHYIKEYGLDASHFLGQGYLKGKKNLFVPKRPLKEVLVKNSTHHSTNALRKRLINEGLLKPICSSCGLDAWLGQPMRLELDHINGMNTDNRISNLRILCPNCHSLTDTYRGKNKRG